MKVDEIIKKIEDFCPKSLAYEWDNPGLQLGSISKEIKSVYLTLDVTGDTVNEALSKKCDMIISHHPLFFNPVKSIDFKTPEGALIQKLIQNNITVYSAHTNMDRAEYGLNHLLAIKAGIRDPQPLNDENLGKIGFIDQKTLKNYADEISSVLNTTVKVFGNPEKLIKISAVCSGAGADAAKDAIQKNADVLITGDVKYHTALLCSEYDFAVIDAGHFATEAFVADIFEKILKNTNLNIFKSTVPDKVFFRTV